jgi:uncharacterized protein (DUF433 family)
MTARMIDRGPEMEGTRFTVDRIMDFLAYDDPPEVIARELELTMDQARVALDYIEAHRAEVEASSRAILERVSRPNPPWVEAMLVKSPEELKRRILRRGRG